MLLAIDSGNTDIVFALFKGSEKLKVWRLQNNPRRTADEYFVWFSHLLNIDGYDYKQINKVVIASVVPDALRHLQSMSAKFLNVEAIVVGEGIRHIMPRILLDKPQSVGADRIVNVMSAYKYYGGPAIVIDFGTATTFDVMDADGNYLGGAIAPGVNLSMEALTNRAAKLPPVNFAKPDNIIGKNTTHAMQSGAYWGYLSLVEGMVARIKQEVGGSMKVIVTGGLAMTFAGDTTIFDVVDQDLTIKGLVLIAEAING